MDNIYELDQLRRQMDILKQKLSAQTIVNDRLLRRSMRQTASRIERYYRTNICVCAMLIPITFQVYYRQMHLSYIFVLVTALLMVVDIIYMKGTRRLVRQSNYSEATLVESYNLVLQAKRRDNRWVPFGIGGGCLWMGWLLWECQQADLIGCNAFDLGWIAVCGVIGMAVGLHIHNRNQRRFGQLLQHITDLTATENEPDSAPL